MVFVILAFTAIIPSVIAGTTFSRLGYYVDPNLGACPPDQELLLDDKLVRDRTKLDNGISVIEKGSVRHRATLIAAGLRLCQYRLEPYYANYHNPIRQTVIRKRGNGMFNPAKELKEMKGKPVTFLRQGEKNGQFKYLISPSGWPWEPYGKIIHKLDETVRWKVLSRSPRRVLLDKPTYEEYNQCKKHMMEVYQLVAWVLPELAYRTMQIPPEQPNNFYGIDFNDYWSLIRIDETITNNGKVPQPKIGQFMIGSQYPILDNAEYEGVCFSKRRNPGYNLLKAIEEGIEWKRVIKTAGVLDDDEVPSP
ncbi:hypothetical protein FRC02_011497 [Tulasnella sp. 418]|nr:hypothetical protein FRC02_011497 [Tulasnella sp. 418]